MQSSRVSVVGLVALLASCGGSATSSSTEESSSTGDEVGAAPRGEPRVRGTSVDAVLPIGAHPHAAQRVVVDSSGRYGMARSADGTYSFFDTQTRLPRIVTSMGYGAGYGDLDLMAVAPNGLRAVIGLRDSGGDVALVSIDVPSGLATDLIGRDHEVMASWLDVDPALESIYLLLDADFVDEDEEDDEDEEGDEDLGADAEDADVDEDEEDEEDEEDAADEESDGEGYILEIRNADGSVRCRSGRMTLDLPFLGRRGFVLDDGSGIVVAGWERAYRVTNTCASTVLPEEVDVVPGAEGFEHLVLDSACVFTPNEDTDVSEADGAPPSGVSEHDVVGVIAIPSRHSLVVTTDLSAVEWSAAGPRVLHCGAGAARLMENEGRAFLVGPSEVCDVERDEAPHARVRSLAMTMDMRMAVIVGADARSREETQLVELPTFRVIAHAPEVRHDDADGAASAFFTRDGAFVAIATARGLVVLDTATGRPVRHRLPRNVVVVGIDEERTAFAVKLGGQRYGGTVTRFDPSHPSARGAELNLWLSRLAEQTLPDVECREGRDHILDTPTGGVLDIGPCAPVDRRFVTLDGASAYALVGRADVELHGATADDVVTLRTVNHGSRVDTLAGPPFAFAVDSAGHAAFLGTEPAIRVRRAGDARTAELAVPTSDPSVLAILGRILGAP